MHDKKPQSADKKPAQAPPPLPPPSGHTSPAPPHMSPEERRKEELLGHVADLNAAIVLCLPSRELHAVHPWTFFYQFDPQRHSGDFMEAAKKLEMYFTALQKEDEPEPTKEQLLQQEIEIMEEELETKNALIKKNAELIQMWRGQLKEQLDRHLTELERV